MMRSVTRVKIVWSFGSLLAIFFIIIAILAVGPRQDDHVFIAITAWATTFLAVGTLIAMAYQADVAKRASEVGIVIALSEQWDSPRMDEIRKAITEHFRNGGRDCEREATHVLDFLESVAVYVNRDYLSLDLADNQFGWSILGYWAVLEQHVADMRAHYHDPTVYCELEAVASAIRQRSPSDLSSEELRAKTLQPRSGH